MNEPSLSLPRATWREVMFLTATAMVDKRITLTDGLQLIETIVICIERQHGQKNVGVALFNKGKVRLKDTYEFVIKEKSVT